MKTRDVIVLLLQFESLGISIQLSVGLTFTPDSNHKPHIHFKDGTHMEQADQVMYLGGTITTQASRHAEVSSRMTKTFVT